jgi:hypothetical protein
MSHKLVSLYIGDGEYYTRTDADAVIAELKAQKAQAEDDCAYWKSMAKRNAADNSVMAKQRAEAFKRERYQKYKRCLAMAMWCCDACDKWMMRKAKAIGLGKDGVKEYHQARRKLFHYMRWQTRWLKLAEKFKG